MSVKRTTWNLLMVMSTLALAVPLGPASAQAPNLVKWRYDYNLARREALERKLPILIDFFKEGCAPCLIQDNTTFRDPQIVNLVNEHFIPLKINGEVERALADPLKIDRFPIMVLAAYDGKILQPFLIGKQDAPELYTHLQRVLNSLTEPEWMLRDYQLAGKLVQNREFSRAIATLLNIVQDGKTWPVQVSARKLLQDMEVIGQERLKEAGDMINRGRVTEGIEAINETLRTYQGLQVAKDGGVMLDRVMQSPEIRQQQRTKRAQELLAQAQDFFKSKDHIPCLDRCEILMGSYGDLPQGQEAFQLFSNIKNDPKWLETACDTMSDRLGKGWIALAEKLLREGQPDRSRYYLDRVIRAFPATSLAESAQIRLTQLNGVPTRHLEPNAASTRP